MRTTPPLLRAAAIFAAIVGATACDSGGGVEGDPCGPGGGLVVGECVLGLTADSDSTDVVARLGVPDRYHADPEEFGLRFLDYFDHPEGGRVGITFAPRGLFVVSVSNGFSATTESGIGYGTPRAEVRRQFGQPDASDSSPGGFDRYEFPSDSVSFQFGYGTFDGETGVTSVMLRVASENVF